MSRKGVGKVLLWDVMDTLVKDPFRDTMPSFFGMTLEELLRQKHPTAWVRFERGELTEAEFLRTFFEDGRSYDHEGFKTAVRDAYRWIDGIEPLLAELAARGVEMHALSNYPEWYRWIEERLQVSRYVSWSFVSCDTALRKPDPAAYERALVALNRPADACIFVDDRRVNCDAASGAGMHAIHFTGSIDSLRKALTDLLLL